MQVKYNPQKNIFVSAADDILLPQVVWHVTGRCKLDCKTCFVKACSFNVCDLSYDDIEKNLEFLKQLKTQKIDISGGEPLLFENLPFLTEQAQKNGFYLTITTRGNGLKENILFLTVNWRAFSRIIVSMDGYDQKMCDYYSGYAGTFEESIAFLKKLDAENCCNLRINTVVNRTLLNDDRIARLCKLIEELHPCEWCIIQPHPLNKKAEFDNYAVDGNDFSQFVEKSKILMKQSKTQILSRSTLQYSTYWCLYPDNTIARLSDKAGYSFSCKLNSSNMEYIKQNIALADQILPD